MRYWENKASFPIKLAIIRHGWGDAVPAAYLWYRLGDLRVLSDEALTAIKEAAFPGCNPGLGDIEVKANTSIEGAFALRRRPLAQLPSPIRDGT